MKKEERSEKQEIIVFDTGIEMDEDTEMFWAACCAGPFIPVRR